jgi:hypothetical protein
VAEIAAPHCRIRTMFGNSIPLVCVCHSQLDDHTESARERRAHTSGFSMVGCEKDCSQPQWIQRSKPGPSTAWENRSSRAVANFVTAKLDFEDAVQVTEEGRLTGSPDLMTASSHFAAVILHQGI